MKRELPILHNIYICSNGFWGIILGVFFFIFLISESHETDIESQLIEGGDFGNVSSKIDGVFLSQENTGYFTGNGDVYKLEFTTLDPNEKNKWYSYGYLNNLKSGDRISIEISSNNEQQFRIENTVSELPLIVNKGYFFVLAIILIILIVIVNTGYTKYKLITEGGFTKGIVYKVSEGYVGINGVHNYKVYIRYAFNTNINNRLIVKIHDKDDFKIGSSRRMFYSLKTENKGILVKDIPCFTKKYIVREWIKKGKI